MTAFDLTPDYEGRRIVDSPERLEYIRDKHPEMGNNMNLVYETLSAPEHVRQSTRDNDVHLYYRWYTGLTIGHKYICVVAKVTPSTATVITSYPTDKIKSGGLVWDNQT